MVMVGKNPKNNSSIRQKFQYRSFAKVRDKYFGKFLFRKKS